MKVLDAGELNAPERIAELAWFAVYQQWLKGDGQPMAKWLRDPNSVIVDNAREFLAALVLGQVKKKRGNKKQWPGCFERQIAAQVYGARERLFKKKNKPHEAAISEVAKAHRITKGTVRGIVQRLREAGITYQRWQQWGRPSWELPKDP